MLDTVERIFAVVRSDLPDLSFRLELWDGRARQYGEPPPAFVLRINDPAAVSAVSDLGSIGFGEAYMNGSLEVEGDLQALVSIAFQPSLKDIRLSIWDKARLLTQVACSRNDRHRARHNAAHHYDLGNDFYRLWLDESMTYSCAYWDEGCQTLEEAQAAKYDLICRKLYLEEGDRLVDIGCGWGGMLLHAAEHYGVSGVGYTLSTEQEAYANARFKEAGLFPRVRALLLDYREAEGRFDKFVSIGMFEHVGKEYYDVFFAKVAELLDPGGVGLLHTIGKDREGETDPWIQKYIFPGGYLPSLTQIIDPLANHGLVLTDLENMRLHYAHTLDSWAERFERQVEMVERQFDESFVRMWRFYLSACSAGFKYGDIRVYQTTFTNGLRHDLPLTRAHLYRETAASQH